MCSSDLEHKLGQQASDTCSLSFEACRVGDDALLGAEGRGYPIALSNLESGRIGIAAQSVGMAQAALEIAVVLVETAALHRLLRDGLFVRGLADRPITGWQALRVAAYGNLTSIAISLLLPASLLFAS